MELSTCLSKVEIEEYLGALPVGIEFAPTDSQLINDYLLRKFVYGIKPAFDAFPLINILDYTPDQLQEWFIPRNSRNREWYFFSKREYRHEKSKFQVLRQLNNNLGFWKKQSKHTVVAIHDIGRQSLGTKNILDFYSLHNSKSNKTDWIMHEFISPNHDNLISLYKIFMSRPAIKRKRELKDNVLRCQHIKAARSTQEDQVALSAQEQLYTSNKIINCQYAQDHHMTTTLSIDQSQQQSLALPQDHEQHINSSVVVSNESCQRIIFDQEIVATSPSQDQGLLQPSCHLRNPTKEYIDVEKYFDNMTGSNPHHELNSSRSWTNGDFEQLFA